MSERDETETPSYREERGKAAAQADARERLAEVPLAPSSAGVIGQTPASEATTADVERDAAAPRERERQ